MSLKFTFNIVAFAFAQHVNLTFNTSIQQIGLGLYCPSQQSVRPLRFFTYEFLIKGKKKQSIDYIYLSVHKEVFNTSVPALGCV